jgi:hypothetical protein
MIEPVGMTQRQRLSVVGATLNAFSARCTTSARCARSPMASALSLVVGGFLVGAEGGGIDQRCQPRPAGECGARDETTPPTVGDQR